MLHSLEDMRSSSALPSDHNIIVLGEYQMCLFSAFMINVYVCVCVSMCLCVSVLYICE